MWQIVSIGKSILQFHVKTIKIIMISPNNLTSCLHTIVTTQIPPFLIPAWNSVYYMRV